jgi:hypothetical protein
LRRDNFDLYVNLTKNSSNVLMSSLFSQKVVLHVYVGLIGCNQGDGSKGKSGEGWSQPCASWGN